MSWFQKEKVKPKIGLVLPGGGARAAYQVGVLRAIAKMVPKNAKSPFDIITGTSAGSINAVALAIYADQFRTGVSRISRVWMNFHVHHVFRTDLIGILLTGLHWLMAMVFWGLGKYNPHSLLNRRPLYPLLQRWLPCEKIQEAIDAGHIDALGITASSYDSGHSVTFYQGKKDLPPWSRERRIGVAQKITVDHMMASSAIPFIFSAIHLNGEYYGDGSMRQVAPISPALHLGAERVLVVGIRKEDDEEDVAPPKNTQYPPMAQVASHVLSSIFLDSLQADLERLGRINNTVSLIPDKHIKQGNTTLRPIESLVISPSESIDTIAAKHTRCLPLTMRVLLRGIGAFSEHGASLVSYLLFEKAFCRELIELGYQDAMRVKDDIHTFLDLPELIDETTSDSAANSIVEPANPPVDPIVDTQEKPES